MKRITDIVANALLMVAGTLITISTLSLLTQVISRYVFNSPTVWSEELAIFCFVWCTMLAVPVGFLRREHIVIGFAVDALPRALQRVVNPLTDLVSAVTLGVIGFFAVRLLAAAERQSMSGLTMLFDTRIPLTYLYLAVPVGLALCVVMILCRIAMPLSKSNPAADGIKTPGTDI